MKQGDLVPEFEATDQHGQTQTLSGLLADGPVVLFFYPRAMTPGCTKESCHFRDLAGDFAAVGARPVGVSGDSVARQKQFDDKHGLAMTLLADVDSKIARIFGVKLPLVPILKRQTFVIGTDRTVRAVIASARNMEIHADEALAVLGRDA